MKTVQPTTGAGGDAWNFFKAALEKLVAEMIPPPAPSAGGGIDKEEMKRMVMEAVSGVLVEGNLVEKLVVRSLKSLFKSEGGEVNEEIFPTEAIYKICEKAFRSLSSRHLAPILSKEIQQVVQQKLVEFGNTEEFKSIMDARFRMMENYLRQEVIPKVIRNTLSDRQPH